MNGQSEFTITNAELVSYPRGEKARRIHTVRHRLELKAGPYTVPGQFHTTPGSPPLRAIGWRLRWSPSRTDGARPAAAAGHGGRRSARAD